MKVEKVPIDSINIDPSNVRKHNDKNISAIKGSLSKFTQVEPLVVQKSTKNIIAGNGRYDAMKKLGYKDVDVHFVDVDDVTAMTMAIALNRTSELAEWDRDALASQLLQLEELDFDLGEIGFDKDFLDENCKRPDFEPGDILDQGMLDELKPIFCKCPHCGVILDARSYEVDPRLGNE